MAPPRDEALPGLDALVVVEGFNDCLALHRAVRAPVYVMGGGGALADSMRPELRYLGTLAAAGVLPRQLVVFTDPDWQGRTFRTMLDDELRVAAEKAAAAAAKARAKAGAATGAAGAAGVAAAAKGSAVGGVGEAAVLRPGARRQLKPATAAVTGVEAKQEVSAAAPAAGIDGEVVVRHAFLRVELATSEAERGWHEAGNVGVEHATADTIRSCLRRARPGFGPGRTEFTAEGLQADGLIGVWNDKTKVAGPGLRRGRFCRALGIDEVGSGKALANLLNRYFSQADYAAALEACQLQQAAGQKEAAV